MNGVKNSDCLCPLHRLALGKYLTFTSVFSSLVYERKCPITSTQMKISHIRLDYHSQQESHTFKISIVRLLNNISFSRKFKQF